MAASPERAAERRAGLTWPVLALLLALAALVRVPGLSTDFWLDEIWSLEGFALRARSMKELLLGAGFKHDNNHPLNSLERALVTARVLSMLGFWLCTLAGVLAHASFVHVYVGAFLWSAVRLMRGAGPLGPRCVAILRLHAVPLGCLAAVHVGILRGAGRGGGPPWTWSEVADDALAWTLGYPIRTIPAALALALVGAILLHELFRLWREGDDRWLLHAGVIVLAPALTLAFFGRPYLFARYFLVPLAFLLLALASALARLAQRPRIGKPAAALLLVAFGAGNALHLAPFYDHGRGGARAAVRHVLEHSAPGEIALSGAPVDLWTEAPARFYARWLAPERALRYVERASLRASSRGGGMSVDWFVEQSEAREPPVPAAEIRVAGQPFELAAAFPAYGPSGLAWFLYRRRD